MLFLSRLEKEKGIGELLEVIPFVVDRYPTISFLIAGSGAYQERMKCHSSLDRCGNNIKFVGYLLGEDKLDAFRCADIYVFPSYSEGCPVSVLEALASGLPIIYTPVGALQEIMVSGENGLEVPVRSAKALADALISLASDADLRKLMAKKNIELSKKFDLAAVHSKLERIYAQI